MTCGLGEIVVLFKNSLHRDPLSLVLFFLTTPSHLSQQTGRGRGARPVAAPPGEALPAAEDHFLVGWRAERERARGRGGGSVSAGRFEDQLAGGCRKRPGSRCSAASFPPRRQAWRPWQCCGPGSWAPAVEPSQVGAAGMLPRGEVGRPGRSRTEWGGSSGPLSRRCSRRPEFLLFSEPRAQGPRFGSRGRVFSPRVFLLKKMQPAFPQVDDFCSL